jgi:ferric-dicitrate binding protein FerR (iron transport regulator)
MTADRFDVLYELYCDGALSPAEREEFLGHLETPAGRARFVELSTFVSVVADEVRYLVVPEHEKPSTRTLKAVRPAARRVRVRRSPGGVPAAVVIGIAAAAFVGLVALIASMSGAPKPLPPRETPVVERKAPVPGTTQPPPPEAPRPAPKPAALEPRVERREPEPFVAPPRPAPEAPEPARPVEPPPSPAPRKAAEKETTIAFVAHVESAAGKVSVPGGKGLKPGDGVETGPDGYALVRLGDGTKVELGGSTAISKVSERSVQVERGLVEVDAAKQPAGKPLVFGTPHAEAAVLGTGFTLWVTSRYSRLDVREGRVRFARLPGVTSATVGAGQFAVTGLPDLVARTAPAGWKAPAQGLNLWLKAETVARGPVSAWSDSSGNGLHAVQSSAAAQPALVANAWAGRPSIRFDGVDDHLELPAGFADFRAGMSVFVAARVESGPLWMRFLDLGKGPMCDNVFFGRKDGPHSLCLWVYANGVTRGKVNAPEGLVPDQVQSLSAVMSGAGKVALYRNGAAVGAGSTSVPAAVVRKPNYVGRSNYGESDPTLKGEIFEVLLFNRALSEQERAYIESYFALKYFDPTSPPALVRPSEK